MIVWRENVLAVGYGRTRQAQWHLLPLMRTPRNRVDWWQWFRFGVGVSYWDASHRTLYLEVGAWTWQARFVQRTADVRV